MRNHSGSRGEMDCITSAVLRIMMYRKGWHCAKCKKNLKCYNRAIDHRCVKHYCKCQIKGGYDCGKTTKGADVRHGV